MKADCTSIGLNLHEEAEDPEKCYARQFTCGEVEFDYLGYRFCGGNISVRKKSVDRLRESLIKALSVYRYEKSKNLELLRWSLNLRITGCIFDQRKFGWLFFFSQMDDRALLHSLDHFLSRQQARFGVSTNVKSFTKAFFEITRNISRTRYIPNFDKYNVSQKRLILSSVFGLDLGRMAAPEVEYHFKRKILGNIRDLERDLAAAS